MKLRIGKHQVWLLCGLLLALPVAHANKAQEEASERQQREQQQRNQQQYQRGAPMGGGYLEKDTPRDTTKSNRENRRTTLQPPSHPRADPEQRYESAPRYAPRQMNLSEAVAAAERSTGGRVLSAEPIDEGGRLVYRVKVLTPDGRVSVLYLDAQ